MAGRCSYQTSEPPHDMMDHLFATLVIGCLDFLGGKEPPVSLSRKEHWRGIYLLPDPHGTMENESW